jgi:hypothetical protein
MDSGLEPCRNCHVRLASTWGHLIADSLGGAFQSHNLTLLCRQCNLEQAIDLWPWLWPLSAEPDFLEIIGVADRCEMTADDDPVNYLKSLVRLQPTVDLDRFGWLLDWKGYGSEWQPMATIGN